MIFHKMKFISKGNMKIGKIANGVEYRGRNQNLERRNVERTVFRNFEIANIQIKKD